MSSFVYNRDIPNAPNDPSVDQPNMKINNNSIEDWSAVDHVGYNTSGGGRHLQVTFNSNNVPGVFPVSPPILFTNLQNSIPQLFFFSGDAAHSSNQYVIGGSDNSSGSVLLMGGIIVKWFTVTFTANFQAFTFAGLGINAFPNHAFAASVTANSNFTAGYNALSSSGITILHGNGSTPITTGVIVIGN